MVDPDSLRRESPITHSFTSNPLSAVVKKCHCSLEKAGNAKPTWFRSARSKRSQASYVAVRLQLSLDREA
jgi:hypothetical protein